MNGIREEEEVKVTEKRMKKIGFVEMVGNGGDG